MTQTFEPSAAQAAFGQIVLPRHLTEIFQEIYSAPYRQLTQTLQEIYSAPYRQLTQTLQEINSAPYRQLTQTLQEINSAPYRHLVDMMGTCGTLKFYGPTMQQLARGTGVFALYKQVLDSLSSSFQLTCTDRSRSYAPGPSASGCAGDFSTATDFAEVSDGRSNTGTKGTLDSSLLTRVRRYNPELMLLIALISLIVTTLTAGVTVLMWRESGSSLTPSQLDQVIRSLLHSCLSGAQREPGDPDPRPTFTKLQATTDDGSLGRTDAGRP